MERANKVLLVAPEGAEARFDQQLFADAGFTTSVARSGADAAMALKVELPDLLVLERILPDGDGLTLLRVAKGGEGFLPVLVVSALGDTAERVRGLQLGADDYLARPCDPSELLARSRSLLRQKEMHDSLRRTQRDLERLVVSDLVTGLYNRRYLLERLGQEFHRVDRHHQPIGFAMLDLDGFKGINDACGHTVGDRVLKEVGDAIARSLRQLDVAARYGGDEFAVVLPHTSPEGAVRVCERLLRAVSAVRVPVDDEGGTVGITLSVGLAFHPSPLIDGPDELIQAADAALYRAKRQGKNRLCASRPEVQARA